jgi:carboxypeptidase family protein
MMSRFWSSIPRLVTVALLVMSLGALLYAQSTTDGAIGGTVYDSTGAVVSNAKVSVHNDGTNAEQAVTSDASGYYRVTGLTPGTYTVTVAGGGFAPYKAQKVVVSVGSVTDLSPRLNVAGTAEIVEVTGAAPQINTTSPEFAPTLNQTAISNLPINGGRWSSFAALTPGVVSNSSGFGLLSFRGISTLLNNNTIDGADNNQAFFSEERGRTRAGYSTAKVAVEEFQVNTSNYSAEYGRSAGGVVNTVTKSGTNSIHGEGFFYDRDNVWGATNPFAKLSVQSTPGGPFTPVPYKPTDWRKMAGFGAGGAIIKDKLFWYVAYDWYHRNFPGTGVASNPQQFFAVQTTSSLNITSLAQRMNGLPATGPGSTPTPTQLQTALNTWNAALPGLNSMLGPTPRTGEQNIFFPKFDWSINARNHLSTSLNRMRWSSPSGIQTQATNTFGIRSFGDDFVKDTWGVAKLNTMFTNNLSNELRFQYGRDFEYEFAQQPTPYEVANLLNSPRGTNPLGLPPQISITNGFTFGVPTFLQRPSFPDESRAQYADTLAWTKGRHSFKFGVDYSHVNDLSQNLRTQFGSYSYSSLLNYITDLTVPRGCATSNTATPSIPCYNSNGFSQAFGPLGFEFTTNDYAVFVQDDFKILPRLSLSYGLRYEYEQLPQPFNNLVNPDIPQTGHRPSDQNNFGPRAGFAWDVFGRGKTILRGGYGIYYGRIINSTIFNALTNTGMPGSQVTFSFSPTTTSPIFPTVLASAPPPSPTARPNVTFFDNHFQNPQIHQIDLTVEHDLGWNTVLSVSYLGSMGRELPNFVDTNICLTSTQTGCIGGTGFGTGPKTVTYNIVNGGPIGSSTLTQTVFTSRPTVPAALLSTCPNCKYGSMTDIFSGVNSNYQALSVQVNHQFSHHAQFNANYTWAHSIDFGQNESTFSDTNDLLVPNDLSADKGNSIYDVRHRFVVNAVVTSPWKHSGWMQYLADGWSIAPIFQFQTGLPFSLSTSGSAPGSLGGANGSNGAFRLAATGRNTFRFPSTYVQDLRVSKNFTVREKYTLELIADAFNLANHTNVTGVTTLGYSVATNSVATPSGPFACSTAAPCLNFNLDQNNGFAQVFATPTSGNSNFTYSPRQLQLGVRVKF